MKFKLPATAGILLVIALAGMTFFFTRLSNTPLFAQSTLFEDSFTMGIDNSEWQPYLNLSRLNDQQWYWQNGQVNFDPNAGPTEAHDGLFMHKNEFWTDYVFEADIRGTNAGMWFRGTYEESSYPGQKVTGYYVVLKSDRAILWKIQTETNCTTACGKPQNLYHFTNPTEITHVPFSNNGSTTYHVKIALQGPQITVSVDGSQILQASDGDFPHGTVGFKTYKHAASFDNVTVTGTAGTDSTPPVCGPDFDTPFKSFEGIRMYMPGSRSYDNESGIKSGVWEVKDGNGNLIKKLDVLNGYLTDIPAGRYALTLELTNGSNKTTTCSQELLVYSPDGFKGTVNVQEVDDYVIPSYSGPLYADNNPKRAIIVSWPGKNSRFIFWHESAYEPHWEFPNGAGMKYQFFEGAHGSGELLNKYGRMDKNSYPEIVQDNNKLAIVKWWYYDVNMDSGERVAYAEEYFYFFPNGLILREQELQWGESFEPMEFIMINPAKQYWWNTVQKVGDNYHMSTMIDIYGGSSRDHWAQPQGDINRAECWASGASGEAMEAAKGMLFRSHYANYVDPYIIYGDESFVPHDDIQELCRWKYPHFVHGNIGWINSEWKKATVEELNTYPTCTPLLGTNHYGNGPYYWLIGASDESNQILAERGKAWLKDIYFPPCTSSECDLEEPPEIDPPPTESNWTYKSELNVCRKTDTPGTQTCAETDAPISLSQGWNVIALPENILDTTTLWFHKQAREAQKPIEKVSIWSDKNRFEGTTDISGTIYGNGAPLDSATAVFCFVDADTELEDFPYPNTTGSNSSITWRKGWNAVALRKDHVGNGQDSKKFLNTTLPAIAKQITHSKSHISYYSTSKQRWVSQILDNGNFYGDEFTVEPDRAYFVYLGT